MYSTMLADVGTFFQQYWLVFVLLALIIVLYVVSFVRRKKYTEQTQQMLDALKPGAKVKTYSGVYGTIVSIKETTDGKVILLETGEGSKVSYTTIDANSVYGIDQKEDVVYDKDGNIIDKDEKKEEVKTDVNSETKEKTVKSAPVTEKKVEQKEEPKTETKKKTSKPKTQTKKTEPKKVETKQEPKQENKEEK